MGKPKIIFDISINLVGLTAFYTLKENLRGTLLLLVVLKMGLKTFLGHKGTQ